MKGLVNQGIRQLVIAKMGEEGWLRMAQKVGLNATSFQALESYDDSLTYRLVQVISEELGAPQDDVLKLFGKYWLEFADQSGYGPLMAMFGADLRSCLKNLNRMHARMGVSMPGIKPPRFEVEEASVDHIRLTYLSERPGLGGMVLGLLEGLGERYGEKIRVSRDESVTGGKGLVFDVHFISS